MARVRVMPIYFRNVVERRLEKDIHDILQVDSFSKQTIKHTPLRSYWDVLTLRGAEMLQPPMTPSCSTE